MVGEAGSMTSARRRSAAGPARPAPGATPEPGLALALGLALAVAAGIGPARAQAPAPEQRRDERREAQPEAARPPLGNVIIQWDHLDDSNDRNFEDFWAFGSYKQSHAQVWYGQYTKGVEVGGFLKDRRRSTYGGLYRYRQDFDHVVQFDTEQILKKGFVLAGMVRGIQVIPDDPTVDKHQVQFGAGFDYYWSDWNFASVRAISDPREGGRWSLIASNRFQWDPTFYVQPGVVVSTDNSTGWFLQGRYRLLRWGVGNYDRFDWTAVNRTVYSLGVEFSY